MKKVYFYPINTQRILKCFKKEYKYAYLGISWNIFEHDKTQEAYKILQEFIEKCDKIAKPWYTPRWFLNLLYLFGNDWSIVRCRNRFFSNFLSNLTKGILITDIKIKYESLRIYGRFTEDLYNESNKVCKKIDNILNK